VSRDLGYSGTPLTIHGVETCLILEFLLKLSKYTHAPHQSYKSHIMHACVAKMREISPFIYTIGDLSHPPT
jgi:hypothetical protein